MSCFDQVLLGFSVNWELVFSLIGKTSSGVLSSGDCNFNLGGSALNISMAFKILSGEGIHPSLFYLDSENNPFPTREALIEKGISVFPLFLLKKAPIASIEVAGKHGRGSIIGYKGEHIKNQRAWREEELLLQQHIERLKYGVIVLSGVRPFPCEVELANTMFINSRGLRVLSLHSTFVDALAKVISRKGVCLDLLGTTNVLFLNQQEVSRFPNMIGFLQDHTRIWLVVMTNGLDGGSVFFRNDENEDFSEFSYPAFKNGNYISSVGAGDWFLASVLTYLLRRGGDTLKKRIACLSDEDFLKQAMNYAARVVSLKVAFAGGAEGPSAQKLKEKDLLL